MHLPAWDGGARPRVILHVTHPSEIEAGGGADRILELGKNLRVRFLQHVREYVEPPPVRHADDGLPHTPICGSADNLIEDGDEHVQAFDREARLAGKRPMEKTLEHLHLRDSIEQRVRARRIHWRQEASGLGGMTQPLALLGHEHMRVVEAGRRAVDAPKLLDRLVGVRRRLGGGAANERRRELPQLVVANPVRAGRQRGIAGRRRTKRVDASRKMSVAPDRLRKIGRADDDVNVRRHRADAARGRAGFGGYPRFEHPSRGRVDRLGVLQVFLVQLLDIPGVHARELLQPHILSIVTQSSRPGLPSPATFA